MKRAGLAFTIAIVAFAPHAHAGFEDSLGVGPTAMSLGGSFAARGGSYASAYYNPAGLAVSSDERAEHGGFLEIAAGMVYAHPTLHVTSASGANLLTPAAVQNAAPIGVPDTGGFLLGTRFSVGRPFKIDGLDFGAALFIPGKLFNWLDRPDDDIQWALMDDRTQVISIHAGLAYRISKFISVGVSVRALFNVQTNTNGIVTSVNLDPKTDTVQTNVQLGSDSQVYGQAYPIVGVLISPIERLRIAAVYRNASYVNDWGTTQIQNVPDLGTIGYTSHFAHYYEPLEVTLAASFDLTRSIDVSADVTYARWSDALSNNLNFWGPGRWGDTVTPALGVRWKATRALSLMAGYRFQKSPVDNFGGPSNLLDCDRHVESLGLDLHLGELFKAPSFDLHFTGGLQYTVLVDREETKNAQLFASDALLQSNPGYPSYSYGGHMIATQATLEARW
jgi:long-subunit fatty acid transport protein